MSTLHERADVASAGHPPQQGGRRGKIPLDGAGQVGTIVAAVLAAAVAFTCRLVPVLRGGGLHGLGNYDDAVHFAATVGLVNGRLPYRDFLLLQPPGILLLLSPFAAVGQVIGDPRAFALARLGWMGLGALTAALVAVLLRRHGRAAMLAGGLSYAVFFPISYVERSTLLEGPQNTLLVIALLLLAPHLTERASRWPWSRSAVGRAPAAEIGWPRAVFAGCALGLVVTIKIWGVATVLVVVLWLALGGRRRDAVTTFLAATASAGVVYLIFFVQAPTAMWQMVVTDQLGRRWLGSLSGRLAIATGLSPNGSGRADPILLLLALVVLLAAMVLAARSALGRIAVGSYLIFAVVLVATPSMFLHYGALVGAPTALVLGTAVGELAGRGAPVPRWRTALSMLAALALVAGTGWFEPQSTTGARFPISAKVRRAVADAPGCVTFDDPGTALQLDVLRRNLDRGCPLVVDLGGRSYHPPMIRAVPRNRNTLWQTYALDYLRGGDVALISRFRTGGGFSAATRAVVRGWPLLARSGPVDVRRPPGR